MAQIQGANVERVESLASRTGRAWATSDWGISDALGFGMGERSGIIGRHQSGPLEECPDTIHAARGAESENTPAHVPGPTVTGRVNVLPGRGPAQTELRFVTPATVRHPGSQRESILPDPWTPWPSPASTGTAWGGSQAPWIAAERLPSPMACGAPARALRTAAAPSRQRVVDGLQPPTAAD
jgi:hypothetical protein